MRRYLARVARWIVNKCCPALYRDLRLAEYAKQWLLPRPSPNADNYVPSHLIGCQPRLLSVEEQLKRLRAWKDAQHQELYRQLRNDSRINTGFLGRSWLGGSALHNGYYPTPDAEIYASMILDLQPDRIVEVGSGFSTLIARRAIGYAGLGTRLTVIDPAPRTEVEGVADEVIRRPVEESGLCEREWGEEDMLFIDSSHVTRARGDIPYLFCRLIPKLPPRVCVHVHDVFIPWDYPTNYDAFCYSEQYVLYALLAGTAKYRTLLSTHYLSRQHSAQMQELFGPLAARDALFFGASFWFRVGADAA